MNNRFVRLIAVTMALVMVMALSGCNGSRQGSTEPVGDMSYTITVVNRAATAIEKCVVEVYSDSTLSRQIYKGITNSDGVVTFTAPVCDDYVAVISRQPTGYAIESFYALTGERTDIVLIPGVLTDEDMDRVEYSLGNAMMDFSVSTPDGAVLKLSDLLKEKKAVVLNFWFLNCQPCKMEFPYIQQGYEELSEDIAVLALNPYDGTEAEVAQFQADNGYSFTMAKCDSRWQKMMKIQSYPTTVIVDRFGNICLIHYGMIKNAEEFTHMVSYFVNDDYEQKFFRSASQIPTSAS